MNTTRDLKAAAAIAEVREKTGHMREAAITLGHAGALLQKAANHLDAAEFIDHETGQPKRPVPALNGLLRGKMTEAVMLAAERCDHNATMAEMLLKLAGPDPVEDPIKENPMPSRPPHQQRVIDEFSELRDRRAKLADFVGGHPLHTGLDTREKGRLRRQLDLMGQLESILAERIEAF